MNRLPDAKPHAASCTRKNETKCGNALRRRTSPWPIGNLRLSWPTHLRQVCCAKSAPLGPLGREQRVVQKPSACPEADHVLRYDGEARSKGCPRTCAGSGGNARSRTQWQSPTTERSARQRVHQADPENDHRRDLDKVRVSANTAAQNIVVSITELNTAQGGTASRHHGAEHDEEDQKNASQNGLYGKEHRLRHDPRPSRSVRRRPLRGPLRDLLFLDVRRLFLPLHL